MALSNGDNYYSSLDAASSGLIEEVRNLQVRALNQHENYLNNSSLVHKLEADINELCMEIKKLKSKNTERHCQVEKVNSQNTDLRKVIDKEEKLLETVTKKKVEVRDEIKACKNDFLRKLCEHETLMTESATRFTSAPHEYGFKMNSDTDTIRIKVMEMTTKTQKTIIEENNQASAELKMVESELAEVEKTINMLDEIGLELHVTALKKHQSQQLKDIEAQLNTKTELEKKLQDYNFRRA